MKTLISILLFSLLGFLGCSGSDDVTSTTVGQSTPVAPFGIIDTTTPTYEWTPVPWATKYRLVVQDTNQESTIQDTPEAPIIDEWCTAEEAGCASEDDLCEATPDGAVIGKNRFKVQACEKENCGPWSESISFNFSTTNTPRFTDHGDGTVTDNNTGLMWSKTANYGNPLIWDAAISYCEDLTLADLSDWRLPALSELKTLLHRRDIPPSLPDGHPFTDVDTGRYGLYWSTTKVDTPYPPITQAWGVKFGIGIVYYQLMTVEENMWCVRGGN